MPYSQFLVTEKPRRPLGRFLKAIWRDTMALLHEFRWSLFWFAFVLIGLGYIYGELYFIARGESIYWIDRPYIMLQLMILETPEAAPTEWYLIIFWYALPVIFVFIVGRGAADFLQLFFNRDNRRDAWSEALASTYRHHVIVFGAGHVGLRVTRVLVHLGTDVIVIDNDPDKGVEEELDELKVPLISGDGRVPSTLEKAGLRYAEAIVMCTGDDHINLDAIMHARDMNPDIRIVARVWDNQYANQIERFLGVQYVFSSSDLAAPAFAASALGIEITQTIQVAGKHYSTLRLTVLSGSFMEGQSVGDLQHDYDMDIVLYGRGEEVDVQPPQELVLQAGDTVVIFAQHERILEVAARNRDGNLKRRK